MIATYPNRRFQLWEYRVSHGSLLIRSPKSAKVARNVDLVFVGVKYLGVPTVMTGVVVERGGEEELAAMVAVIGDVDPERLFVIVADDQRFPVVAVACRVDENDDDIFDSPFQ